MTERQWLRCARLEKMLYFLHAHASGTSGRKARLFACACVRADMGAVEGPCQLQAVEVGEAYADGQCGREELRRAQDDACGGFNSMYWAASTDDCWHAVEAALHSGCFRSRRAQRRGVWWVRCVFGNPFRPASLAARRTPTIIGLAQAAYEERFLPGGELDGLRLNVLADALEEAGCAGADVLEHLRSAGPHVRGCWALDLILGKEGCSLKEPSRPAAPARRRVRGSLP